MKPTGIKYITRMDYPRAHGWWVRILDNRDGNGTISRFFRDTKYTSKEEGLSEAIKFRDRHFNHLTRSQKTVKHDQKLGKIYADGVFITWKTRNGWSYPHACASWWEDGRQHHRTFSVEKYGYDEAWKLAEDVRKQITKHKEDCRVQRT